MAVLINQKDCNVTRKNLGVPDCILQNGRVVGFIAVDPAWQLDLSTDTFTLAEANGFIQDGTFIPVLGAVEAINGTPEAVTEEYQGGIMSVVRNGLPMFTFKFLKGWAYARALYSMNSFQAYKLLLVFEDGSISGAVNGNLFSGYDLGMLNTSTYFHTDGAVSGNNTTTVQLTNADQYNLYTGVLDRSTLGFDANALFPITDIAMVGRADVSEQKIYFKPTFAMNGASPLGGIVTGSLRFTINSVVDTITALSTTYDPITKEYSFEPTTAFILTDDLQVTLYDTVNSVAVAKIGQKYYEGTTGEFNPTA